MKFDVPKKVLARPLNASLPLVAALDFGVVMKKGPFELTIHLYR